MEKCDVGWGDFLEFSKLFFNEEMWRGMRWCDMLLEFLELFSIEKGDVSWCDFLGFLELFFNREMWCGILVEFLELFFHGERWHDIRWFSWIFWIVFQCRKIMWHKVIWHTPWFFRNIFQCRKMTWYEMMWHSCILRKLKLVICSGSYKYTYRHLVIRYLGWGSRKARRCKINLGDEHGGFYTGSDPLEE
jgi:hypothetical protein